MAKLKPGDVDAQRKLHECEKVVRALRFASAIASHDAPEEDVAASIDLSSMSAAFWCLLCSASLTTLTAVDASYTGAQLGEGDCLSLEFVKHMIADFKAERLLHRRYAFAILLRAKALLTELPTLVDVPVPAGTHITVCGDVHGQFYDLLNVFELNGMPSEEHPYLFNGDFVDRGSFSVEVIFTLLALKCLYPTGLHLTRGNHETRAMNSIYGFEGEVRAKYSETMVKLFAQTFRCLPLGAVLGGKVFVVHGGLFSRDDVTLDELRALDRFREPPDEGPMTEMLWSDPQPMLGRAPSKRGVGVGFGADVTRAFLQRNGLQLVVRSHEVKEEGYEVTHDGLCVTIFSAPNYCDSMGNKGAFIVFNGEDMVPHFTSYTSVPHPPVRPMRYAAPMLSLM